MSIIHERNKVGEKMLTRVESNNEKISMGLLSLSNDLETTAELLDELKWFKAEDDRKLYLYKEDSSSDYIALIGIEISGEVILIRRFNITPSFRNEGYGFKMLDELDELYSDKKLTSTLENSQVLVEWQQRKDKEE